MGEREGGGIREMAGDAVNGGVRKRMNFWLGDGNPGDHDCRDGILSELARQVPLAISFQAHNALMIAGVRRRNTNELLFQN
jgi:hypothetical protein